MLERCERMATVACRHAVVAIVQQDDIPSSRPAQAVNHAFSGLRIPIARRPRPHYNARVSVFPYNTREQGATESERWTHPARPATRGALDRIVATLQLGGYFGP